MQTRTLDEVGAAGDLHWFAPALERLRAPLGADGATGAEFLDPSRSITIARAPGRLDVMGGIADYSGSLVLELPLACATVAIAQPQDVRRLDVRSVRGGQAFDFGIALDAMLAGALDADASLGAPLAEWFTERPDDRWAAYVVGAVYRCLTIAGAVPPPYGLRILILSDVPEGKGVSSSAALEVATMAATASAYGIPMSGAELAAACQWAENNIARAPCGIMDQMTSALGQRNRLLRLLCQPATVEGHLAVPPGYRFYGIDSGVRHAVTGADYGTVRTAAFMGYRMIADMVGLPVRVHDGAARVEDDRWGGAGYLANISPSEFSARFADRLPLRMDGAAFVARYGGITDLVTRVDPRTSYPVRYATAHPVYEHDRVSRFGDLLDNGLGESDAAHDMGELMLESHASYGACGLGSDGTDRLVSLVTDAGSKRGLFGAKITGGGSGGTVAVFGRDTGAARDAVLEIARQYERETGLAAAVFDGSSPGAEEIGTLRMDVWR